MSNSSLFHELTSEVLQGLRDFEVLIPHEDVEINDMTMISTTIHFPKASCILASMKFDNSEKIQVPDSLKVVVYPIEFAAKHKKNQHSESHLIKYPTQVKGGKNLHLRNFSPMLFSPNVIKIC